MEIITVTGARCLPQSGSFAVSGQVRSEWSGWQVAVRVATGSPRTAVFDGRPVYRTRVHSLINPDGNAMPVTPHMRMSASEP